MEGRPQVVVQRRSFLSTLAMSLGALGVTATLAVAAVVLYGMNIADRKSDSLAGVFETAIRGLPNLQKALPPVLADLLSDRRRPDYARQLVVSARLVPGEDGFGRRALIEVENKGSELVTLLSLRVVVLDEEGSPVAERNEWPATPIAVDDNDWPGPLLPGAKRRVTTGFWHPRLDPRVAGLNVEVEVTDIRVWKAEGAATGLERQV
jgi:hypothetical protein